MFGLVCRTKVSFAAGGEKFSVSGRAVISPGFTAVMPWLAVADESLPTFSVGETISLSEVELYQGRTAAPDYLTESELITLMEKHGIGTDASIPVHINNICERNYAQVQSGRRVVPTALGITLVRGYQTIDIDLCLPDIRRFIEQQITLIAKGQMDYTRVVQHALQEFSAKFNYFVAQIEHMDALFEAQFSPLADSGKPLSKCGKCSRYMKYIAMRPSRLYCASCEEVHHLPQNGAIKLYTELTCPLDNFELVIFSLAGPDGKSYPLCPYCYNHPPFEGAEVIFGGVGSGKDGGKGTGKGSRGMPCSICPHPTCRHSMIQQGVCSCPECDGTLVLDPISAPKWRLDCNKCNCLVYLPHNAHRISVSKDHCDDCGSALLEVNFNKNATPLTGGATLHKACVLCDELLHSLVEVKHGKAFFKRSGRGRSGRGRGRGRQSRGRGRGRVDPRMSFRDF
jgi:DNA topoisomerase-3